MFTYRELITEAVLGYQFWTLFQAVAPMIWFYPLNELEITGYEGFALALFSPILLGVPGLGVLLRNNNVTTLLRLVSVAGLASFQAATTLSRLLILITGASSIMVVMATSLTHDSPHYRSQTIAGLMLGNFAFVSSRVWFTSFVPAWWSVTSNSVVIAVVTLAVVDKMLSEPREHSADIEVFKSSTDKSTIKSPSGDRLSSSSPPPSTPPHTPLSLSPPLIAGSWLSTALGFGSLLYVTQALYGEASVISRWVVKGYPDHGPDPYPWGAMVLIALWFGSVASCVVRFSTSLLWWTVGSASFITLYLCHTYIAYLGGVVFAVYVASIWPVMLDQVTLCPPGRTFTVAALTWLVEILFSVWTVAYNFVPGGVYTREKTLWLIIACILTIGLAIFTGRRLASPFLEPGSYSAFLPPNTKSKDSKEHRPTVIILITLILFVGLCGFGYRVPRQSIAYEPKRNLTACIWTYHFGYDNVGWPSLTRSASLLRDTGADVITLLESDASKPFLGNNDLGMWLGEELGMHVDFGPSTRDHTWGNLILSKYPIVKSTHHLLPSPHGELAPAITATINLGAAKSGAVTEGGGEALVDFVVTHMGNDRDELDRKLQADFLAHQLSSAINPVVFLGYVTSKPFSRDYQTLTQRGNCKDIDPTDKDRWCEYIMYRGLTRLGYARISHGGLSDTEVQCARFSIPESKESEQQLDNDRVVTDPDLVDESVRFSSRFGAHETGHNWARAHEHRYHMSTPKYFIPKQ